MVTVSEMATDARVCREAEALVDAGYSVRILCLASPIPPMIRGVELIERDYSKLPRRARLIAMSLGFLAATLVRSSDVYHAHNVPALPACWLAARLRRARLVYDAHELYALDSRFPEGGEGDHTRRQHVEAAIERTLGRTADLRLTASEGYARVIARSLGIEPPIAVPNYPPLPERIVDSPLRALSGAGDDDIVVLYQGGFYMSSRALDTVVRGMRLLPERYCLVLLGFGVMGEERQLAAIAKAEGVDDRVTILPSVRHQELPKYTAGADIGVIPLRLINDATRLCAPNKLYEYFQGSVAVLSTAADELAAALASTGAGRTYAFDSPEDFAAQALALGATREDLAEVGQRGRVAAVDSYSWEAVQHVLIDAYEGAHMTQLHKAARVAEDPGESEARRAARAQWQANPAGVSLAQETAEGSAEFFAEMTRTRYEANPWLPALLRGWAPRGTLLEIGCGAGTDHSILRGTADRSIGIDLALRGAALSDARIQLEGGRGKAVVADGEHLPLADGSVDAVYSFGVIHHTDHPERVVAEMARVMRPSGSFFVAVYHRYSLFAFQKVVFYVLGHHWGRGTWRRYLAGLEYGGDHQTEPPVIKLYSRRTIRLVFKNAGFSDLRTTVLHPYGFGVDLPRAFDPLGWYVVVRGRKPQ